MSQNGAKLENFFEKKKLACWEFVILKAAQSYNNYIPLSDNIFYIL